MGSLVLDKMREGFLIMQNEIDSFIAYLHNVKKTSENTKLSYQRDLKKLCMFLEERDVEAVSQIKEDDCRRILKS